jgi:hypothetical protein
MGEMMMTTSLLLLHGIEDHNGGLSSLSLLLLSSLSRSIFLLNASPADGSTTTTATTVTTWARWQDDRVLEMKARAHVGSILHQMVEEELGEDCRRDST